jgi:Ca2+-binding EF-hand superfamily protein
LSTRINHAARLMIAGFAALATTIGSDAQVIKISPENRALHLAAVFPATIGRKFHEYRLDLQMQFERFDATGDGLLTAEDPVVFTMVRRARVRVQDENRPWVKYHDFDGDGDVTESEIRRGMAFDLRMYTPRAPPEGLQHVSDMIDKAVAEAMAADADGDGRITPVEAKNLPAGISYPEREDIVSGVRDALMIGIGPTDGEINLQSFMLEGEKWFRDTDTDSNGFVSPEEYLSRSKKIGDAIMAQIARPQ